MNGALELVFAYSYAVESFQAEHGDMARPDPGRAFVIAFQNGLLIMEHRETGICSFAFCCKTCFRLSKIGLIPPIAIADAITAHFEHQKEVRSLQKGEVFAVVYPDLIVLCYEEDGMEHASIYKEQPIVIDDKLECFSPESESYLFPLNMRQLNHRGFVEQMPDGHSITILDETVSQYKHIFRFWYDESDECALEILVMIDSQTMP